MNWADIVLEILDAAYDPTYLQPQNVPFYFQHGVSLPAETRYPQETGMTRILVSHGHHQSCTEVETT